MLFRRPALSMGRSVPNKPIVSDGVRLGAFALLTLGAGPKGSPGTSAAHGFPGFRPKRLQPRPRRTVRQREKGKDPPCGTGLSLFSNARCGGGAALEAPDGKPHESGASSSRCAPATQRFLFSKLNKAKALRFSNDCRTILRIAWRFGKTHETPLIGRASLCLGFVRK